MSSSSEIINDSLSSLDCSPCIDEDLIPSVNYSQVDGEFQIISPSSTLDNGLISHWKLEVKYNQNINWTTFLDNIGFNQTLSNVTFPLGSGYLRWVAVCK